MKDKKIWVPKNPILRRMSYDTRNKSRSITLSMLEANPKGSFLDLGCSVGDFTVEMAKKIGTPKVFGVDKTTYANSKILVYAADLDKSIPFGDGEFDVVVASQLIEHLKNPQLLLGEIHRCLKPTGYAIISTPNLAAWHNILYLLLGKQPTGLSTQWDHRFLITTEGLLELLRHYGFKIEKVMGVGFYPLFGPLERLACFLDKKHSVDVVVKVRK